jgi:hypothetical protein
MHVMCATDPFVELTDNFLGQRLVVERIQAFLHGERKGRRISDGPAVFVFVGIPGTALFSLRCCGGVVDVMGCDVMWVQVRVRRIWQV